MPDDDVQVIVKRQPATAAESIEIRTAEEFVKELERTNDPEAAAQAVNVPLAKLERSPHVLSRLQELSQYNFTSNPDAMRAFIHSAMAKIVLEGEDKDKIGAAKVIIQDPTLGFVSDKPLVQIVLSEELQKIEPGPLWPNEESNK